VTTSTLRAAAAPLSLLLALCTAAAATHGAPVTGAGAARNGGAPSTANVIIISIDGLRPDAIERFEARVLQRMLREGAYSLAARTVHPSITLPSHTSMLTGVSPEVHGITWNSDETRTRGVVEVPTVFELAHAAGFSTAAFFSKAKLRHLQKEGTLDHVQAPSGVDVLMATRTVEDATRYIRFRRPSLVFIHLAEPDVAGHSFGWMGRTYRMAVRRVDGGVGQILQAADVAYGAGNYTVLVTADHGGHGRGHGSEQEHDVLIPWIAWGARVEPGLITVPVRTMDTAATALWLLGVPAPAAWEGVPVMSAFEGVSVAG
jgi:arylsulfatase A-like enzyme